jgi:hypothetical protein
MVQYYRKNSFVNYLQMDKTYVQYKYIPSGPATAILPTSMYVFIKIIRDSYVKKLCSIYISLSPCATNIRWVKNIERS